MDIIHTCRVTVRLRGQGAISFTPDTVSAIAGKSKHARASNMDGDDQHDEPDEWCTHGLADGAHLTDGVSEASSFYEMSSVNYCEWGNDMIINNSFTDAKPCTVGRWPTATDDGKTERERERDHPTWVY